MLMRRKSILATMQRTLILTVETMHLDQDAFHAAKQEMIVAKARSAAKKVEKLESELANLVGSNISALTSVHLKLFAMKLLI